MSTAINFLVGLLWKGEGDARKAKRDLKDLGETGEKSAKQLDQSSKVLEGVKKQLATLGVAGLAVGAGKAFLDFSRQSVSAAAAVEEGLSKASVVFGDFYQGAREELQLFAQEANRSQYDLIDMASGIQALVVPMGLAREEAADLSINMTKLAEDLASFHNTDAVEAANAIRSGLAGESEPLKRYGVLLTEARVKAEALEAGIWDGVGAMSEAEKIQARINILMRDTADAQGDAVRTADSYTNTVRGWEAAMKDFQVLWGQQILPQIAPVLGGATNVLGSMVNGLDEPIDQASRGGLINQNLGLYSLGSLFYWLQGTGLDPKGNFTKWYEQIAAQAQELIDTQSSAAMADQLFSNYLPAPPAAPPAPPAGSPYLDFSGSGFIGAGVTQADQQAQQLTHFTQLWESVAGAVQNVAEAQERVAQADIWEQADALEQLAAANGDLTESHVQWAYDLIYGQEQATDKTIDLAVQLGLLTQAQADLQKQSALVRGEMELLAESEDFAAFSASAQATAIQQVAEGISAQEAIGRELTAQKYDPIAAFFDSGRDNIGIDASRVTSDLSDIQADLDAYDRSEYEAEVLIEDSLAIEELQRLEQYLNEVTADRVITIDVREKKKDDGTGGGYSSAFTGAHFTVPDGYPNDSYLMGVTSGETVSVTPFGQAQGGGGGGPVIHITNHISSGAQVDVAQLEQVQRRATIQALRQEGLIP